MKDEVTLKDLYDQIAEFRKEMNGTYVTKEEFKPVKALVYGFVALVLVAFVGALLAITIPSTSRANTVTTSQPK